MQNHLSDALMAVRPHQWVKNILIFAPLILSFQFLNIKSVTEAVLAFLAFSLTASGLYIINDLLDIEADRAHPTKRNRPFASGRLSKNWGIGQSIVVLVLALAIAFFLNP